MKYFSVEGSSKEEVIQKIKKNYGDKVIIYKFLTEEIPIKTTEMKKTGLFKKTPQETIVMKKVHKAWCGLPELEDKEKKTTPNENISKEPLEKTTVEQYSSLREPENKYEELKQEINQIKDLFENFLTREIEEENLIQKQKEENIEPMKNYLLQNDFSLSWSNQFIQNFQTPISQLDTFKIILKEKIRLNTNILPGFPQNLLSRFFILLGPTGVGKTTTLAKLAAIFFFEKNKKIRFFTFDSYRLGAAKQLEQYANVFNQPFVLIQNEKDLKNALKNVKEEEVVFIDTAGESLSKEIKLSEVENFLKLFPEKVERILTINANAKSADLKKIKEKFKRFSIDYYIITKLDETITIGPIIELLYQNPVPAIYFTTGQAVPEDIQKADIEKLLEYLTE